jgi:hypothetical protein
VTSLHQAGGFEKVQPIGMESATPTINQEKGADFQQLKNYAMELESRNRILEGQYNTLT